MEAELVLDARAELGEGPAWDELRGRLTWVDILAGDLHIFHPQDGSDDKFHLGAPLGCAARMQQGGMLLGMGRRIAACDIEKMEVTTLVELEPDLPGNRCNDGKCDPAGRFVVGTMDNAEKKADGSLYSYSSDGTLQVLLSGVRISNGMTWSPDGETYYYIDTPTRLVQAFDYDLENGRLSRPRRVVSIPPEMGWPDGMTADREGKLWVALWGGARITRWDPGSGRLLESILIPALNVSACAFGGAGMDELYITSARKGMSRRQLDEYPLSGSLFRLQTGVEGAPSHFFGRQERHNPEWRAKS